MTENEAIKIIGEVSVSLNSKATLTEIRNAYDVVKKAIEELVQLKSEYNRVLKFNDRQGKIIDEYEAIGTVEGYKRAIKVSKENYYLCAEYKAKLKEYEAIGTIDEFKALKDKNEPKKPILSKEQDVRYVKKYDCPSCGKSFTGNCSKNCYHCGQALDWSE